MLRLWADMADLVPAEGGILAQILDASHEIWHDGLTRAGYGRFYHAQQLTAWGDAHLTRSALVDGPRVLASAKEYAFQGVLDGRAIRIVGIGAVFTQPAHRGSGHARDLIERLIARAAGRGADLALLFSEIGPDYYARLDFTVVPTVDRTLTVVMSDRHGAPATMIRAGDDRDLAGIVAMNRVRAEPFRFHLDRDRDLVTYAITKKRLLAGFGPFGLRELQFFVAEEGTTGVAYVVVSVRGGAWTLEECGDRDPSGARVGAILQALIARQPAEQHPAIRARLPPGFVPPQVTIAAPRPSSEIMMVRPLNAMAEPARTLTEQDVLYWYSDLF
jgi:GNAT superfamily N-acetyltransferase